MKSRNSAFTLVELLVVLAVIAILAAILFPVFGRARESGRQTSCASNLHQISIAVALYYSDEKRYPCAISDLLPNSDTLYNTTGQNVDGTTNSANSITDTNGGGYFKYGMTALVCPDDSTESLVPRSSYGDVSNDMELPVSSQSLKNGLQGGTGPDVDTTVDPARYVWNAYGYDANGWAYGIGDAATAGNAAPSLLVSGSGTFGSNNPIKNSLYNRFAVPSQTIVTHCIFHRGSTGSNIGAPGQLYTVGGVGGGSRDIVLLLDGTAKTLDVSTFQTGTNQWQSPSFN